MLHTTLLLEIANQNLLLGFIPESLGLLIFGIGLVVLTIGLRWIFNRIETAKGEQKAQKAD